MKHIRFNLLTKYTLVFLTLIYSSHGHSQFEAEYENNIEGFSRLFIEEEPFAYFLTKGKWTFSNREKEINVCWEQYTDKYKKQRSLVEYSIEDSWEKYSPIKFVGWDKCRENETGVRIKIANLRPQVSALGAEISGEKDGMILNFEFDLEGYRSCKKKEYYEICIRTLAVHEFGHALGFAHEHNRKDAREQGCMKSDKSVGDDDSLTPYDEDSVMNYCNPDLYKNMGKLSYYDVVALHEIYGKPK